MSCCLEYLDYYIPSKQVDVKDVLSSTEIDINQFMDDTGINTVNVFEQYELPSALDNMFERLFRGSDINRSKIKYIACETTPLTKYHNISIVHFLQKKYGLEKSKILPLHQPCAFVLYAMGLSNILLDEDEFMLILCANDWSEKVLCERFLKFTIMGDGAAVALIKKSSSDKGISILDWHYENYGVSSFNTYNSKQFNDEPVLNRLSMIKKGVDFITHSLAKSNRKMADVNKIIVSNVRHDVFRNTYSKLLGVTEDIFYLENTQEGGHVNDIDIIRNLKDYLQNNNGELKKELIALYTLDIEESRDINYHLLFLNT